MGSVGGLTPCPYHVGGGPSPGEKAYKALRRAVGTGGSAKDETGIDGLWRQCRANGLAAAWSAKERAALQFSPHLATDALPYYERLTGLTRGQSETDAAFRRRAWEAFTAAVKADCPSVDADLKAIDSRVSLLEPTYTTTTQHGRAFGPLDASLEDPSMSPSSVAANFSTDFVLFVLFDVGHSGAMTASEARTFARIEQYLVGVLPSWVDFVIVTDTGFILDISSLDITGFGA